MTWQWAETQIDSAHRDADGGTHGHTWKVRAHRRVDPQTIPDAMDWFERVDIAALSFDHRVLEPHEQWAEQLAEHIGKRTGADKVTVSRKVRGGKVGATWPS